MFRWTRLRWTLLLAAIVGGHVALWMSPRTSTEAALRLTLTNAAIWSVVFVPAIGVSMWARTHRARAAAADEAGAAQAQRAGATPKASERE